MEHVIRTPQSLHKGMRTPTLIPDGAGERATWDRVVGENKEERGEKGSGADLRVGNERQCTRWTPKGTKSLPQSGDRAARQRASIIRGQPLVGPVG